jgi:hypothetical protein
MDAVRELTQDKSLPAHTRPVFFAANELLLELIYITRDYAKLDLESLLILLCVSDATMRPFMQAVASEPPPANERVDESIRGSISRRLVADKTGLPRETVRRRIEDLVDTGLIFVDDQGRLRSSPLLGDADLQRAIDAMHAAVGRYQERLGQFQVSPE